jgi:glycyl-tRNA synthetase
MKVKFFKRYLIFFILSTIKDDDFLTHNNMKNDIFEKVLSLCKRRGFFYQSADIYGGMNGFYDKGPLGTLLARNIEHCWIREMETSGYQMLLVDGSIIGSQQMWKASGHVDGFSDPLVDCKDCQMRFRADDIDLEKHCTHCGKKNWSDVRQFHMMFSTQIGAMEDSHAKGYLRPETAQTIFVQFKNIMTTNRVKIPFGVMQIGKAFRNEITPKQFLFRTREFSQMEMEFFCKPDEAFNFFTFWVNQRFAFFKKLGLTEDVIRVTPHKEEDLSHYSKATSDIEYLYPFGWKEIEGIAYRTDFDLRSHSLHSKKDLSLFDEEKKASYVPHVVETSVGVERLLLVLLCNAYHEELEETGDTRVVLRLPLQVVPYVAAVFPLTKHEVALAKLIEKKLSALWRVQYDESGSIGKRYRRQDEIGTPFCITVDSESGIAETVTIRFRDSKKQERVKMNDLAAYIQRIIG